MFSTKRLLILVLIVVMSINTIVFADNEYVTDEELNRVTSLNNIAMEVNRQKINEIDEEIMDMEMKLDTYQIEYLNYKNLIEKNEEEIKVAELTLENEYDLMLKRNYQDIIENMDKIVFLNANTIQNEKKIIFNKKSEIVIKLESLLEDLKNNRSQLIEESGNKKMVYENSKLQYEKLSEKLLQLVSYEFYLINQNSLTEREKQTIQSKLQSVMNGESMYAFLVNRGDSHSEIGDKIVEESKKYLGVPYVWGGTSPKGMDCSGLVLLVMNAFGIETPRVSYEQAKFGTEVSLSKIQPGDVLFFDTLLLDRVSHTGIYIGNGELLHAPKTGDVVKISKLNRYYQSAFITARRFY